MKCMDKLEVNTVAKYTTPQMHDVLLTHWTNKCCPSAMKGFDTGQMEPVQALGALDHR